MRLTPELVAAAPKVLLRDHLDGGLRPAMGGVSLGAEFPVLGEEHGIDLADMQWLTHNAMKSAFVHFDQRLHLIDKIIKPGYRDLGLR